MSPPNAGPDEASTVAAATDTTTRKHTRRGCCGLPPLRHARNAPSYVLVPHIQKGYRVNFTIKECVLSLFTLHNESVNVWSHLLGAGYMVSACTHFFILKDGLLPMTLGENLAISVFLITALTCLVLSSLYHLFGCLSERAFGIFLRLDLLGIALLIFGSYVPGIYYGFHCFPISQGFYQVVTALNLILGLAGAIFTDLYCPKQSAIRTNTFAFLVAFGLVPAIHWCFIVPPRVRWAFIDNLAGMLLFYAFGFVFWTTRFPERYIKDRFDFLLSSHQLWHICICLAVFTWYHGILEYHTIMNTEGCNVFD